jgi:L,D-transpeptidase catalytic domain
MPPASTLRVSGLLIYVFSVFTLMTGAPAFARVLIIVDKSAQQMSVSVDGVPRYSFAVSTGRAGYGTPNGTYHPQRLAASWFSKLYYNSPMPHSIFFHGGYAIHGSYEINRLGGPASHDCIRLHPANAAALFELVKSEGTGATSIVVPEALPASRRVMCLRNAPTAYGENLRETVAIAPWRAFRPLLASRAKQLFVLMCHGV